MKELRKGEDTTGNILKIVCVFLLLLIAGMKSSGQSGVPQADSLKTRQQANQSDYRADNQNGNAYGAQNSGNGNSRQAVKRVRAGRPDMSRARGARPPVIVRPSGSGIPKGIGKPGGVGRHGGR